MSETTAVQETVAAVEEAVESAVAKVQFFGVQMTEKTAGMIIGILGLLTIVAIVITLFKSKTQPAFAFIIWPTILGIVLLISGRYTLDNLAAMIKTGFGSTGPTAALFVFSVLYFGIMTDAGMFDVIINKLMKLVGDSVSGVCIMTAVIALIGHLDGGGASTFCIVVPAMLPVYKRMHMRKTTLLRIAVLAMGVLNLMPWAGPTMRAATVAMEGDANALWMKLLPIQIFGIALALAHAVFAGFQEKKRGAGLHGKLAQTEGEISFEVAEEKSSNASDLARPKLFWFNVILTVGVIFLLIWGDSFDIPTYYPFMLGTAIALLVNYGLSAKMHKKIVNLHAGPALMMCSTLMGAAVLMGILTTTFKTVVGDDGKLVMEVMKSKEVMKYLQNDPEVVEKIVHYTPSVVSCLANIVASVLPKFRGQTLPLVIGFLSVPLALAFDTDSYFYGMLPVMIAIGQSFGVDSLPIAIAMVVCRNCATFISPMVPATLLGTGLAEVDIKDHIKSSFLYVWVFSILCMIFAVIWGLLPL